MLWVVHVIFWIIVQFNHILHKHRIKSFLHSHANIVIFYTILQSSHMLQWSHILHNHTIKSYFAQSYNLVIFCTIIQSSHILQWSHILHNHTIKSYIAMKSYLHNHTIKSYFAKSRRILHYHTYGRFRLCDITPTNIQGNSLLNTIFTYFKFTT